MTFSHNDEVLSELMDEFGAEGYGLWWLVLEKIGEMMNETDRCFARYSLKVWANSCRVSVKKFQNFVKFMEKRKVLLLNFENNYLTIECRNLLKYRDEYSKKLRNKVNEYPDNIPTESGQTPAQDTDTETENNNVVVGAGTNNDDETKKTDPPNTAAGTSPGGGEVSPSSDGVKAWMLFFVERYGFKHSIFTNANVLRFCIALAEGGMTPEEMELVITNVHAGSTPKNVSSPCYYQNAAMEFLQAKKNPKLTETGSGQTNKRGNDYADSKRKSQERFSEFIKQIENDDD